MSAVDDAGWTEICTAAGLKLVKVSGGGVHKPGPVTHTSVHVEHCALCITHDGAFALPQSAGLTLALLETQETYPALFYQSPRPLAIWAAAQSRAPPAHS